MNFKKTKLDPEEKAGKKKSSKGPLYLTKNKEDVVWNMAGKTSMWTGCKTSEMVDDYEGRNLLTWAANNKSFNKLARNIILDQLEERFS